jgi:hypothetical protein
MAQNRTDSPPAVKGNLENIARPPQGHQSTTGVCPPRAELALFGFVFKGLEFALFARNCLPKDHLGLTSPLPDWLCLAHIVSKASRLRVPWASRPRGIGTVE